MTLVRVEFLMRARCAGTLPAAEQLLDSVCREDLALTGLGVFWCWLFSLDINFSKHPGHVHAKSTARTAFGKSNTMLLPRFIGGAACEELGGARSKLWCFLNGNGAGNAQPALCWVELHHSPDPEPQVRNSTSLAGAAGSCSCITPNFFRVMLCAGGDGIVCASTVHTAGFVTWGSVSVLLIKCIGLVPAPNIL